MALQEVRVRLGADGVTPRMVPTAGPPPIVGAGEKILPMTCQGSSSS